MMPLTMAPAGVANKIIKVGGKEEVRDIWKIWVLWLAVR